jgi:preprotein translocase subunit SecF
MGHGFTGSGLLGRLYRGETKFDFIAARKKWYLASAIIILICLSSMIFRGFNWGIEFSGGQQYQLPVKSGTSISQIQGVVAPITTVESTQTAGSAGSSTYVVRTERVDPQKQLQIREALAKGGNVTVEQVSLTDVSSSWGSEVTRQAIWALIVFLIVVTAFIWLRFQEWRMAAAGILALLHDLILTAGVYALVGFEVTPGTVVGLLTILGFSLYDTVVVFDKVSENSKGLLSSTRYTYPEAANLAVNQTLMRSINTSIIGLLPVAGLLFVGAGILGVGTLEDLALVLFVGMITGAYSSLFLATPWLVDFKLLDPRYKNHMERVLARRAARREGDTEGKSPARRQAATRKPATADTDADAGVNADADADDEFADAYAGGTPTGAAASSGTAAPRPGAKPAAKRTGTRPGSNNNRPGKRR